MVRKKSSPSNQKPSFRMAFDLRLINAICQGSSHPLPKIDNIINNVSKFKCFIRLDVPSAYFQICLPEKYINKLSFVIPCVTCRHRRLMFGLKTVAPYFFSIVVGRHYRRS